MVATLVMGRFIRPRARGVKPNRLTLANHKASAYQLEFFRASNPKRQERF